MVNIIIALIISKLLLISKNYYLEEKKKKIQKNFLRKGCNNLIVEKLRRENQPKKGQYHENENEYEENIENCIRNVYSSFIQNQLKFNIISISKLYLPKCYLNHLIKLKNN